MSELKSPEELKAFLEEAKKKYGKVFKTSFEGTETFYIRPIQRLEYKNLITALEAVTDQRTRADLHDEKVVTIATVYPEITTDFLSRSGAGFVTLLANEVLRVSGFTNNVETTEV